LNSLGAYTHWKAPPCHGAHHDADYIFGLVGNAVLDALVAETATNLRFHHARKFPSKLLAHKVKSPSNWPNSVSVSRF
jgi:hypothetical protein